MDVQQYNVTKAAVDMENPTGAWAGAPSLAASTVKMVNTSGYTVWMDVAGGTVTAVKVNGTATGLTAGSFRLLAGDNCSITYSAAPTVGWTFDSPSAAVPTGAWSGAPSLATSTTAMFNTSGYPVTVHISAGTVTVIKVDGVTTGLTSGSFRLRRGSSLAITYSVAPTLNWIYA
jgi:hypothetical protein